MSNHDLLQMTKAPDNLRILGAVHDYTEWCKFMQEFDKQLQTTGEDFDAFAGLPEGYTSKVFGPVPVRSPGRFTLGPMLAARGLVLLIAVDETAMQQMRARMTKRKIRPRSNVGLATKRKHRHNGNSAWGKIMRARALLKTTSKQRSAISRANVQKRWNRIRKLRAELATSCA